jgi:hypothetical protein
MKLPSVGRRWGAAVVELLVIDAVHLLALAVVTASVSWTAAARPVTTAALVAAVGFVLTLLYGGTEIFGDGSPAKRLFGLRVRGTPGTKLPPGLLTRRWLVKTVPVTVVVGVAFMIAFGATRDRPLALAALSLVAGVCGLFAFLDVFLAQRHSRQAVHDRIVGAVVVRAGA